MNDTTDVYMGLYEPTTFCFTNSKRTRLNKIGNTLSRR